MAETKVEGEERPDAVPRTRLGRRMHLWGLRRKLARLEKEVYSLSQPYLGRSEFRTVYIGVGSALVVAGITVMANWVSIVQTTARPNALQIAGAMFYLGLGVAALGLYCFVASMSNTPRLWLPGKKPMIRAMEALAIRDQFHSIALGTLGAARVAALILKGPGDLSVQQAVAWYSNVVGTGLAVWGDAAMPLITHIEIDDARSWTKEELVAEIVEPALLSIEATMSRVQSSQIEEVDRNDVARLRRYHKYFWQLITERESGTGAITP